MAKPHAFATAELADVAAGLRRILAAIETGDLTADSGTVARLEGALAAIEALLVGGSRRRSAPKRSVEPGAEAQ